MTLRPPRGNIVLEDEYAVNNMPRAALWRNAAHNISTGGAAQIITWDRLDYDTDGMWDPTKPTILTCRTAGLYACSAAILWPSNSTNYRQMWISRNGGLTIGNIIQPQLVTISSQEVNGQIELNAGDTLGVFAAQNTGGVLTLPGGAVQSSRGDPNQSIVPRTQLCRRTRVSRPNLHVFEKNGSGHCGMRASFGVGSQLGGRSWPHWLRQVPFWARR